MKKILTFLLAILSIFPIMIEAASGIAATIGNKYYESLEDAIEAAGSTDVIKLTTDAVLTESQPINKTVNINLNGHDILADEAVFMVEGGSLNLTGTGNVKETKPNYGAIMIKGADDKSKQNYSTVSVGENITLTGWSGIFIRQDDNNRAYGINVNMNGTIQAVNDVNDNVGAGIYVNGKIQHIENSPIINLSNKAKINSTGDGFYLAGYATVNVNGATIVGVDSGIALKAGILNINSGTINCTGSDRTPTSENNNGINPSGAAIQIESNNNYAGDITLNIKDGLIKSNNSYSLYEYTTNSSPTKVSNISISGGKFVAGASKSVFKFSDSFKSKHTSFISGGEFSSSPAPYLKSGYTIEEKSEIYEVVKTASKEVNYDRKENNQNKKNRFHSLVIIIPILFVFLIISYVFKDKIKLFINSLLKK